MAATQALYVWKAWLLIWTSVWWADNAIK
jgi:hypothetical protein